MLEEVKIREKLLNFDPIADPFDKLNELKQIKQIHVTQILKSEEQATQVEDTLVAYNEIVDKITEKIKYLHS